MLSQAQVDQFGVQGYLVGGDLLDAAALKAILSENEALMDGRYANWAAPGLAPDGDGLWMFDKVDLAARSEATPALELKDWKAWCAMWDAIQTHLATTPHQDQHGWPADAAYCG